MRESSEERERSDESRLSSRLAAGMRRASGVFSRPKSERNLLSKSDSSRRFGSQGPSSQSSRTLGSQTSPAVSSRTLVASDNASAKLATVDKPTTPDKSMMETTVPPDHVDEEQTMVTAFRILPAAGFNRLKTMWANRESMTGFSSPLSTWARPYGNHKKDLNGAEVKVSFDPKMKAYSGKLDTKKPKEPQFKQFGVAIQDCPRTKLANYKEPVPNVLLLLRSELEKQNGFHVEGVFRVAASFEDQKAFKIEVDNGTFKGCQNQDDAICMAALLKEWFRTMPVRLLNALPISSIRAGKADLQKELPEPNLSVFMWLCDLMADIVALEPINRMTARAMAIVIAPNLYSAGDTAAPQEIMQEMNGSVTIVETALKECIERRRSNTQEANDLL